MAAIAPPTRPIDRPLIAGALTFIGLRALGTPHWLDTAAAMFVVLAARLAAIHWHLGLPRFHLLDRH